MRFTDSFLLSSIRSRLRCVFSRLVPHAASLHLRTARRGARSNDFENAANGSGSHRFRFVFAVCIAGTVSPVYAQPAHTMESVVEKAILTNPEVLAQFQSLRSALEGQNIAKGALLPEVNVRGQYGQEWRSNIPNAPSYNWRRHGYTVELRQLLFDGFVARNGVRQQGLEKLSSYYELLATIDNLANEAINAYLDVRRYREMVQLAKDNYQIHSRTLQLLKDRQISGVGRGVDYEQAAGRLALAQTNLMTETNNLNDVTQRYRRIVGELPPPELALAPDITDDLPIGPVDFTVSLRRNPSVLSKQALLLASNAARDAAKGRFSPTVHFVASTGTDREQPSEAYRDVQSSKVEVVLSYNLYRGGADSARLRQASAQRYVARDVRDYTCRNAQQELALAWNNIARLREQLPFLRQHQDAMSKVRVAAEQQFQIGQRSLLDLLDTSNELFDARRALLNGQYDFKQYQYRWLALSHMVLPALGIAPPHQEAPDEGEQLDFKSDALASCIAPVPDISNLKPLSVTYHEGMHPPTLSPLATPATAQ